MAPVDANAQGGGREVRLGNNTEGATLITNGPRAGQIAVLDGFEVSTIPVSRLASGNARPLFDVRDIPWGAFPSGVVYLPPEQRFAFTDQGGLDTLVITDANGRLLAPRPITYLPGNDPPWAAEGMVYLDQNSAFPDTIARAVYGDSGPAIEIMNRSGVVQREIPVVGLPEENFGSYIAGVGYRNGGFLVGTSDRIWRVSLDGDVIGDAIVIPKAVEIDGVVPLPGGQVYAADYAQGRLFAFDPQLHRDPANDRNYEIGAGLTRSIGGYWNPTTRLWTLAGLDRDSGAAAVAELSPSLRSKRTLFHSDAFSTGLTPGPHATLATCAEAAPGVDEYSGNGRLVGNVPFEGAVGMPQDCFRIAYLSSIDAYAVAVGPWTDHGDKVYIVSRSGTLVRTIDAAPLEVLSLSASPDDGVKLFVWGLSLPEETWALQVFDATTGVHLSSSTPTIGTLTFPLTYMAGPNGSYGLLDGNDSRLAVFDGSERSDPGPRPRRHLLQGVSDSLLGRTSERVS